MINDQTFWQQLITDALENKAEYNFLDFKRNLSEKNERLKEHINAFANLERGGCFVFGVEDYKVLGVTSEWDAIITSVVHLARDTQEPVVSVDAFPIEIHEKKLLVIHVLPTASMPVFIKDRAPLGGAACFKRSGSSTIPMSIQEIRDWLINSTHHYEDQNAVEGTTVEQLDFEKLSALLPELDTRNYLSPKNVALLSDCRILISRSKSSEITVAGWLCFAKKPQESRRFRNAFIEIQFFQGGARDVPVKKYEITGSLPNQIEQVIQILQQNLWTIPKITGTKREEVPAYSIPALREVITNSVVHRDYQKMHQPVKVAVFTNRVEIENPGNLMPGLTTYNLIHKRDWRNPLLAELLKKFGLGEMDGQGIDRLYALTLSIKVPAPQFVNNKNSFAVILSAPKSFESFTLEEKKLVVMVLLIMNEVIDNECVRNFFDITAEQASTLIKSMMTEKILQPSGKSRKYAKYVLTEGYREKIFG